MVNARDVVALLPKTFPVYPLHDELDDKRIPSEEASVN